MRVVTPQQVSDQRETSHEEEPEGTYLLLFLRLSLGTRTCFDSTSVIAFLYMAFVAEIPSQAE